MDQFRWFTDSWRVNAYGAFLSAKAVVPDLIARGRGVILLLDRVTPAVDGFLRELDFKVEGIIQRSEPERFQLVASSHRVFHPFASPTSGSTRWRA